VEVLKKIGLHLIGLFICYVCISLFLEDAGELKDLLGDQNGGTKVELVWGKTAERELFGKMTYYAVLTTNAQKYITFETEERALAEVSKDEFEELKFGSEIEGKANGIAITAEDFRSQLYVKLGFMALWLIFPVFYVVYQLIPLLGLLQLNWSERVDVWIMRIFYGVFYGAICLGLLLGYVSMGKSAVNLIETYSGKQIEKEATITDRYYDRNSGKYNSDDYYLALEYKNESGEQFHLTKQVTPSDYHNNDDYITIEYPEDKPYAIHIPGLNISDLFFLMGTSLLLYIITIVLTVLMIYVFICLWRHKKTGSYYKKKVRT